MVVVQKTKNETMGTLMQVFWLKSILNSVSHRDLSNDILKIFISAENTTFFGRNWKSSLSTKM